MRIDSALDQDTAVLERAHGVRGDRNADPEVGAVVEIELTVVCVAEDVGRPDVGAVQPKYARSLVPASQIRRGIDVEPSAVTRTGWIQVVRTGMEQHRWVCQTPDRDDRVVKELLRDATLV